MMVIDRDIKELCLDGLQASGPFRLKVDGVIREFRLEQTNPIRYLPKEEKLDGYTIDTLVSELGGKKEVEDISHYPLDLKASLLGLPESEALNINSHIDYRKGKNRVITYIFFEEERLLMVFAEGELSNSRFSFCYLGAASI